MYVLRRRGMCDDEVIEEIGDVRNGSVYVHTIYAVHARFDVVLVILMS